MEWRNTETSLVDLGARARASEALLLTKLEREESEIHYICEESQRVAWM